MKQQEEKNMRAVFNDAAPIIDNQISMDLVQENFNPSRKV